MNGDKIAESFAAHLHDSMVSLGFCALFEQQDSHDLMLWLTDKLTTTMASLQRTRQSEGLKVGMEMLRDSQLVRMYS